MSKKKNNNSKIKKEEKPINKNHKDKRQNKKQNKKQNKEKKKEIKQQTNNKNNSETFNNNNNNNICLICYSKDEKLIKLKCNHILCSDCYHKWCKIKETCPMCRRKMFNTPAEDPDFENLLRSLYDNRTFLFQKSY
jgi:hypothetical protein